MMNEKIFLFLYNLVKEFPNMNWFVYFLADILPYITVILAGLFLANHYNFFLKGNFSKNVLDNWKKIVSPMIALVFAWVVSYFLKIILLIPRPVDFIANVTPLIKESGYGFPSSHATFFMALAVTIYMINKKSGLVFILFALVIGIARIAAGVHSPVDILGGLVIGALIGYVVDSLSKNV